MRLAPRGGIGDGPAPIAMTTITTPTHTLMEQTESAGNSEGLPMNRAVEVLAIDCDQGQQTPRSAAPQAVRLPRTSGQIVWFYANTVIALHVLALLALVPWLFSWT